MTTNDEARTDWEKKLETGRSFSINTAETIYKHIFALKPVLFVKLD